MKKKMKKEVCDVSVRLVRKCSITRQCCQLHSLPKDPFICSSPALISGYIANLSARKQFASRRSRC